VAVYLALGSIGKNLPKIPLSNRAVVWLSEPFNLLVKYLIKKYVVLWLPQSNFVNHLQGLLGKVAPELPQSCPRVAPELPPIYYI
jgi:hypothetical protein